ncbi:MAG: hypothetical protein HY738_24430 [Bacteroidia bacterium]|nr:hypothetical protein [Bacteroidia bacterium]
MKKKTYSEFYRTISIVLIMFAITFANAQNVAITDDDTYTAHSSAMLDVKSLTKGFLAPRLTTTQRTAIAGPAAGLLVFDTTIGCFYLYNGTSWVNITYGTASGIWSYSAPNIYMTNSTDNLGLGTSTPYHKLHLYQDVSVVDGTDGVLIDIQNSNISTGVMTGIRFTNGTYGTPDAFKGGIFFRDVTSYNRGDLILANNSAADATNVTAADARMIIKNDGVVEVKGSAAAPANKSLFNVQNADGDTVFAVYPQGVRVYVLDDPGVKAAGSRSGFAVGGYSLTKQLTNEFFRVTPDSVRVSIGDTVAGFAINNIQSGTDENLMNLTKQNYFIGHQSGVNNTTGYYNTFLGYEAGLSNTSGFKNVFMGYQAGRNNAGGDRNVIIGHQAGLNNTSDMNICIGDRAGYNNTSVLNVFIGTGAGFSNTSGVSNTFIGNQAGYYNTTGGFNTAIGWYAGGDMYDGGNNIYIGPFAGQINDSGDDNVNIGYFSGANGIGNQNTFIGSLSGRWTTGSGNVFIGYAAGEDETGSNRLYIDNSSTDSPLIYGDFSANYITINGNHKVAGTYFRIIENPGTGVTPTNYCYQGGSAGSTTKQYAFAVNDALWVTNPAWFDGGIYVNNGTKISKIQAGTITVGAHTGGVKLVNVTFTTAFSTTPKVMVTIRGADYSDVFAVTTRNITTTTFQVNVYRVDVAGGQWAQNLQFDWFAWE